VDERDGYRPVTELRENNQQENYGVLGDVRFRNDDESPSPLSIYEMIHDIATHIWG